MGRFKNDDNKNGGKSYEKDTNDNGTGNVDECCIRCGK